MVKIILKDTAFPSDHSIPLDSSHTNASLGLSAGFSCLSIGWGIRVDLRSTLFKSNAAYIA